MELKRSGLQTQGSETQKGPFPGQPGEAVASATTSPCFRAPASRTYRSCYRSLQMSVSPAYANYRLANAMPFGSAVIRAIGVSRSMSSHS